MCLLTESGRPGKRACLGEGREQSKKTRKFTTMRWGLIPSWATDMKIGNQTLNARSETVTTTPSFRDSILTKRCLIPADGFYEWRAMGSVKQPYCFEVGEGDLFALAGLWDQWKSPDPRVVAEWIDERLRPRVEALVDDQGLVKPELEIWRHW